MNLNHVIIEDIARNYLNEGVNIHEQINSVQDSSDLYYKNLKEILVKTIQEHNNIEANINIFETSISIDDDKNMMERLFIQKLVNRIEYEAVCLVIELISKKIGVEEFKQKMNNLRSKEILDFIDSSINKIQG